MPRLKPNSRNNVSKAISNEQFDDYFSDEDFDYDFESDSDYAYDGDDEYKTGSSYTDDSDYSNDAYLDKRNNSKKKK